MALKRRGSEKEDKKIVCENLEEGREYEARLVYIADLGLHENSYEGVKPNVQKIALGYEIIGETVEIDDETFPRLLWDKPFNIYWKMAGNGTELTKYKIFKPTAKENEMADWENVLGTPVNVTITHVPDKKDPKILYDNILSVVPIPKKYHKDVADASITLTVGDADDKDNEATKNLYGLTKWFYDRRLVESDTPEPINPNNGEAEFNPDDEIPF
jgi:hypothetical protein